MQLEGMNNNKDPNNNPRALSLFQMISEDIIHIIEKTHKIKIIIFTLSAHFVWGLNCPILGSCVNNKFPRSFSVEFSNVFFDLAIDHSHCLVNSPGVDSLPDISYCRASIVASPGPPGPI